MSPCNMLLTPFFCGQHILPMVASAMQAYFGERVHFDQVGAMLDSNLEEAWLEALQGVGE